MDAADEGAMTVAAAPARPPKTKQPVAREIVEQIIRWSIEGNREADLRESIKTHWPKQNVRAALVAAYAELAATAQIPRDTAIGWGFSATMEVFRKCMEIGDMQGALRASRQIIELADKYGVDPNLPGASK